MPPPRHYTMEFSWQFLHDAKEILVAFEAGYSTGKSHQLPPLQLRKILPPLRSPVGVRFMARVVDGWIHTSGNDMNALPGTMGIVLEDMLLDAVGDSDDSLGHRHDPGVGIHRVEPVDRADQERLQVPWHFFPRKITDPCRQAGADMENRWAFLSEDAAQGPDLQESLV